MTFGSASWTSKNCFLVLIGILEVNNIQGGRGKNKRKNSFFLEQARDIQQNSGKRMQN